MTHTKTILKSQLPTVMSTPNDAAVLIQRVAQQRNPSALTTHPQEIQMTTTQRTRTRTERVSADPMRRTATIVGWLFVLTYVTSIAAKIALYPPLFDGDYITGTGHDTRAVSYTHLTLPTIYSV